MPTLSPLSPPRASSVVHLHGRLKLAWVAGLLGLSLAAGGAYLWWMQRGAGTEASATGKDTPPRRSGAGRVQPVSVQALQQRDLKVQVAALGTISALQTAAVRSRVDGELLRVHFKEGQEVKAGQLLAELDARAFEVALAQAQGQLARDTAQLRNAQLDLERYRGLLAQDAIAQQQVDTQEALTRQLQGTVQIDQAQVDNAKLQLSYTRIAAPISGRLGLRLVDVGNVVRASDTNGLVTITQTQPINVVFAVPEQHVPTIRARLAAKEPLPVVAWDREQRKPLARGRVFTTDNSIDTSTGTLKLKAEFPNAEGELFPNQFVNIRLQLDTLKDALVAPVAAVQRGSVGTFVYVVKEDSTVSLRRVTVGAQEGDWVSLQGELQPGDRVVTDGADRLRDSAKVEVIARPSRPAGAANAQQGGPTGGPTAATPAPQATAPTNTGAPPPTATGATPPVAPTAKAARTEAPAATPGTAAAAPSSGAAAQGTGPAGEGGERPRWMDRLPPELVEKIKAMPPEERREFLQKLRERRQQREANGG